MLQTIIQLKLHYINYISNRKPIDLAIIICKYTTNLPEKQMEQELRSIQHIIKDCGNIRQARLWIIHKKLGKYPNKIFNLRARKELNRENESQDQ